MKGTSHKILSLIMALVLVVSMFAVLVAPATATAVGAVTVVPTPSTAGAAATYVITSTTTAAIVINVDTISITFPAGTQMPTSISKTAVSLNATVCTVDPAVNGNTVTLIAPVGVAGVTAFNVTFSQVAGIKNPVLGKTTYTVTVVTSTDTTAVVSTAYAITRSVTISPSSVALGGAVTVTGVGFAANSSIDFTGGATGAAGTDANGAFTGTATAAVTATAVTATDGAGNATASTTNVTLIPAISVSPVEANAGSTVTVTMTGLTVGASYGLSWASAQISMATVTTGTILTPIVTATTPSGALASAAGKIVCTIVIPINSTSGAKVLGVKLSDATPAAFTNIGTFNAAAIAASTTFTVSPRSITLDPATGPAGTTVNITGAGFSAFAPAAGSGITFNAAALVPAVTFATAGDGTMTSSIVVPVGTAAGTYAIAATDSNGNVGTKNFVIPAAAAPTATLSPAVGAIGSSVTVTGGNFRALSGVTVQFTTPAPVVTTIVGTGTTDSNGGCMVTFVVPASAAGFATITVTDAAGTAKTATFTVTATVAVVTPVDALTSVSANVPIMWTFNSATQAWQLWDKAATGVSDLTKMTVGQGYWMKSAADCTLTYGVKTYALKAGWNLIGWLG